MEEISKATFQPLSGDEFEIHFDNGELVTLTLDEVNAKEHLDDPELEHFTLIFSGPVDKQLMQAAFPLRHPSAGTHSVFLVPLGPSKDRMLYEAVFSVRKTQPKA